MQACYICLGPATSTRIAYCFAEACFHGICCACIAGTRLLARRHMRSADCLVLC